MTQFEGTYIEWIDSLDRTPAKRVRNRSQKVKVPTTKAKQTKTISENGNRVKYLYQHQMDKPLGKMVNLYEDEKGLMFEAEIPKTQLGKDVLELMKAGVITENSVGILPLQKEGCPDGMENCYRIKS